MNLKNSIIIGASKEEERHAKDSFWASENETNVFDIYHRWKGTPETNPIPEDRKMIMLAGKMIEEACVATASKAMLINSTQDRVEMEREGVKITGYMDAIASDGTIIEIKSFYGDYQAKELEAGKARESYLKQLAIYMDYKDSNEGILLYIDRGTGQMYEFKLERSGNVFTCNNIQFDITDTYKKWARLYNNNILKDIEPKSEYRYKYDIDTLDWSKVSKADISKARNGHKVIGDWQILYSGYKNLIIEREGTTLGYSPEELEKIKEKTKGFTTWK